MLRDGKIWLVAMLATALAGCGEPPRVELRFLPAGDIFVLRTCPSCATRWSEGPSEHTASGRRLCKVCSSEGRRYGWD